MEIRIVKEVRVITVGGPRWLRLPRRRSLRLALVFAAALVVLVPVAWAADRFTDVPVSSPHHDDISAIATAGITRGCNPPANTQYCPGDFVRRDQMASFLQRGLGRAGRSVAINRQLAFTWQAVNSVGITVPGSGFVLVTATGTPQKSLGCDPCKVAVRVSDPVSGEFSQEQVDSVTIAPAGEKDGGMGVTWLFPVTGITSPTPRTFNVDARLYAGAGEVFFDSTVTALWVPFGPLGAGTLGSQSPPAGRSER